ncbi:hypothetical protein CsatA_016209 [Cannabis sativa]
MFPQTSGDNEADGTDTLTAAGLVVDAAAATTTTTAMFGEKNSVWFRYVVLSISVFISHGDAAVVASEQLPDDDDDQIQICSDIQKDDHHVIDMIMKPDWYWDWESLVQIVKEQNLVGLKRRGGLDWVLSLVATSQDTHEEKSTDEEKWKAPIISSKEKGFLYYLLQSCNDCTIFLLVLSAGFLFAIESMQQGPKTGWHDGTAVLVAIFVIIASSSVRNFIGQRELTKKMIKDKSMLMVTVERPNGMKSRMVLSDVKVRDKVYLTEGDHVPGDGVFISGEKLKLVHVFKKFDVDMDKNPFLLAGSRVVEGNGTMIVTSIGDKTIYGEIIPTLLSCDNNYIGHGQTTLFEDLLSVPYGYIEKFGLFMSVLIAFVALIRLLLKKHDSNYNELPELKGHLSIAYMFKLLERLVSKPQGRLSILVNTLVVFVIGIQHGMPLVIGICLHQWRKQKFHSNKVNPQNLSVCGTIGLVTVLYIDATGDLMCKQMDVKECWVGGKDISKEPAFETSQIAANHGKLYQGINVLVNLPKISLSFDDNLLISGVKSRWGGNEEFFGKEFEVVKYRRSISSKKSCGILMRSRTSNQEDQIMQLHWNGPASTILGMCTQFYDSDGKVCSMEESHKDNFGEVVKNMEENGLRPIAFAFGETEDENLKKEDLTLLAMLGLKYSCKEDIKLLVETLRTDNGLIVKLVSEDELSKVRAIACNLDIFGGRNDYIEVEGESFQEMDEPDKEKHTIEAIVMGDFHSKEKLYIVEKSQKNGHVVAFCGGLTAKDIPAMKKADVGIILENRCTEMSRPFYDISFEKLSATHEIRKNSKCIYHNIQKFFQLQLTTGVSGLTITLISTIVLGDSPLTSLDMIWVNLIMSLLGGLMMMMEFKDQQEYLIVANCKPFHRNQSLITKVMWKNIVIQVGYQISLLLIFQWVGLLMMMDKDVLQTIIFNTFVFCQIFNLFNIMNIEKMEVLKVVISNNYWFLITLTTTGALQIMLVQLGIGLLCKSTLNVRWWVLCLFFAAFSSPLKWVIEKIFV